MCVTNVYIDRYPDGKEVEFRKISLCQYGGPVRPCHNNTTLENPVRKIQFGERTTEYLLAIGPSSTTPPPDDSTDDGSSDQATKGSRKKLALPSKPPRGLQRKERFIIVDEPPLPVRPRLLPPSLQPHDAYFSTRKDGDGDLITGGHERGRPFDSGETEIMVEERGMSHEAQMKVEERQKLERRLSTRPENRRHRVLYDDSVYRWEGINDNSRSNADLSGGPDSFDLEKLHVNTGNELGNGPNDESVHAFQDSDRNGLSSPLARPEPIFQEGGSPKRNNGLREQGSRDGISLSTTRDRPVVGPDHERMEQSMGKSSSIDKGSRRKVAEALSAIGEYLRTATPDQVDDSKFKHGKAFDYPKIPGEEQRNPDLNRIRGHYNRSRDVEENLSPDPRRQASRSSFTSNVNSGLDIEPVSTSNLSSPESLVETFNIEYEHPSVAQSAKRNTSTQGTERLIRSKDTSWRGKEKASSSGRESGFHRFHENILLKPILIAKDWGEVVKPYQYEDAETDLESTVTSTTQKHPIEDERDDLAAAWISQVRKRRLRKKGTFANSQKRTISQQTGSSTDDEDMYPVTIESANKEGFYNRRLRRKVGGWRTSLIFDDPPPRMDGAHEVESGEEFIEEDTNEDEGDEAGSIGMKSLFPEGAKLPHPPKTGEEEEATTYSLQKIVAEIRANKSLTESGTMVSTPEKGPDQDLDDTLIFKSYDLFKSREEPTLEEITSRAISRTSAQSVMEMEPKPNAKANNHGDISRSSSKESLQSLVDSIFSIASLSSASTTPIADNAFQRVLVILKSDGILKALYEELTTKTSAAKFNRNFGTLLKRFAVDLEKEATCWNEQRTAQFVRSRARIFAQYISNSVYPFRNSHEPQRITVEKDKDKAESSEDSDFEEPDEFQELEKFIINSNAFQTLRENIRGFLGLEPSLPASHDVVPERGAKTLLAELPFAKDEEHSFTDEIVCSMRDASQYQQSPWPLTGFGQKLRNLLLPVKPIPNGMPRVWWQCVGFKFDRGKQLS